MSSTLQSPSEPTDRRDFEIAIFCALPLEASAVAALLDERWDDRKLGKAPGDTNTYSTGAMSGHNVVLVHLSNIGKVAAACAGGFLRISFEAIKLALVVGICGGVPSGKPPDDEIHLGDVVISDSISQYDFGRKFPHRFIRKDHVRDNLPRPSPLVGTFLAKLKAEEIRSRLRDKTLEHLSVLQKKPGNTATYPGATEDQLFEPTYRHKHNTPSECLKCDSGIAEVCDKALKLGCQDLGCDEQALVRRARSTSLSSTPAIHFGLVASGDSVMKSGEDRDRAAEEGEFVAFEMEGAGLWELFLGCLIIKGVCDYADSHKSRRWQAYAAAAAAATTKAVLENWNTETVYPPRLPYYRHSTPTATGIEPLDPARKGAIFKMLNTSPYRDRKERNPDRVSGTCEWFVNHESFRRWQESTSSSMLWVSADPGCGKSVLAKHLVDSELPSTQSRTTCYFFFKDDFEDQKSARSAISCILLQLFKQNGALLSDKVIERFETDGEHLTKSFGELWDVLISISRDKNAGEIICILDAFDECEDQERAEFTRYLRKFYGTRNNLNLKFLLTSRPYGDIRRGFQPLQIPGLPVIHLSGESEIEMEKIVREIDVYIKAKVRSIREILRLEQSEEQLLLQGLLSVPNRTYLWAHLTLDLVQDDIDIDKTGIHKAISKLPQTIDEAYERILAKSRDSEKAKRLLHIVVAAARPLTLSEMQLALALRESHRSYMDCNLQLEERFSEYVRDICGLFVAIIGSKIYLLHQTAKEFLVQDGTANRQKSSTNQLKWKSSLQTQESHRILAQICIWHLRFEEFELYPVYDNQGLSEYLRNHNFLEYSAKNWAAHFRISCIEDKTVTASLLELCDAHSERCKTWFRIYWEGTGRGGLPNFSTLIIASLFGLRQLVEFLLQAKTFASDYRDHEYRRSALSWASENGFDDIVELLVKRRWYYRKGFINLWVLRGAHVDSKDVYGRTSLSYAARKGHEAVVKRLVKAGARVDLMDNIGGTPMLYALCNGQKTLINLLLRKGHRVNSVHDTLHTLMLSATKNNDETIAQFLLESGKVDANFADNNGRTLLSWAAGNNSRAVVKLLLKYKADANLADNDGRTPLAWAAINNFGGVLKLLLDNKVDANLADNTGRTPLSWAAGKSRYNVVRLLLESSEVNANLIDEKGATPLFWAVRNGCYDVVRLLLENSEVDVNLIDKEGATPLTWAIENGHGDFAELIKKSPTYRRQD